MLELFSENRQKKGYKYQSPVTKEFLCFWALTHGF